MRRANKLFISLLTLALVSMLVKFPVMIDATGQMANATTENGNNYYNNRGYINMLSVIPNTESTEEFDGLVVQGDFEVSIDWDNEQINSATIVSNNGGTVTVDVENGSLATVLDEDGNSVKVEILSHHSISFATEEGKTYTLTNFPQTSPIPTNITATRVDDTTVNLSWDSIDGVTYNIYRQIGSGEVVLLASGLTSASFVDTKAYVQLQDASYYVTAIKNYIESSKSNPATSDDGYMTLSNGSEVKLLWRYNGGGESVLANLQASNENGNSNTVFDNNDSTGIILRYKFGAYDRDNVATGDYLGVEFKEPVHLKDIAFKFHPDADGDKFDNPKLEYKTADGEWQTLGEYESALEILYSNETTLQNVKAVRIVHTGEGKKNWVKFTGINFNLASSITLDRTHMSVMAENYEKNGGSQEGPAELVLDNNPSTIWHTDWGGSQRDSHYLDFTLNDLYIINSVKLRQRPSGSINGVVSKFKLLVKENENDEWVEAISNGTMSSERDVMQTIECQPVKAKYIRVKVEEASSDQSALFASLAEVRFTGYLYVEPVISDGLKVSAKAIDVDSNSITLYWPKIMGASAYVVKNMNTNEEFVTSSNIFKVEGLNSSTAYNFEITVQDYEDAGSFEISGIETLKAEVSRVSNVQLGEVNGYRLTDVSWNHSSDSNIEYYIVYVNGVGYRADTNPYEFVNVGGLGVQTIRVVAFDSNGAKSVPDGCTIRISTKLNEDGTYDRTFWTGAAFDKDSDEENWENTWKDGPVANMLDGKTDTFWHTNYRRSPNKAYLPVYVFVDFGEVLEFDAFNWKQRSNDPNRGNSAKNYEFYINVTDKELIPKTSSAGAPGYENIEDGWLLVKYSYFDEVLSRATDNIVDLDNTYAAKQVMVKITSTYDVASIGQLANITADEFYVFKNHTEEPIQKETSYINGIVEKEGYVRESFYTAIVDGQLVPGDTVLNSDRETHNDAYAKYVTSKVLSVKAQSEIKGDKVNVRFLSSIPSINLETLRFKVEILNSDGTASKTGYINTNRVFETVVSKETNDVVANNPSVVFDNGLSTHFFVGKLNNIPTFETSLEIRVTPYWLPYGATDKDENYVKGIERTFSVQEFVENAPDIMNQG